MTRRRRARATWRWGCVATAVLMFVAAFALVGNDVPIGAVLLITGAAGLALLGAWALVALALAVRPLGRLAMTLLLGAMFAYGSGLVSPEGYWGGRDGADGPSGSCIQQLEHERPDVIPAELPYGESAGLPRSWGTTWWPAGQAGTWRLHDGTSLTLRTGWSATLIAAALTGAALAVAALAFARREHLAQT